MNCEQYDNILNDSIDDLLSDDFKASFLAHTKQCLYCQERYKQALTLKEALRTYPAKEPDAQFEQRMLNAIEEDKTKAPHWISSLVGGALAASFIMWFFFIPASVTTESGLEQISVTLPYQQRKDVQLVFNSPRDIKNATFSITLPEQVELYGRSGLRQLSWQGQIRNGDNRLILPLIAKGNVSGKLTAMLRSGEHSKVFIIKLNSFPGHSI